MKHLLAALFIGIVLIGCNKNNPVDSAVTIGLQTDAMFGETSMYNTTVAGLNGGIFAPDSSASVHDSVRNQRMLDSLKVYLSLSQEQFFSLRVIGATLFTSLVDIRRQVFAETINRDSSKTLVGMARAEFVASVKVILTETQLIQFNTWLTLYWDKPRPGNGLHGGHGPHGGGKK